MGNKTIINAGRVVSDQAIKEAITSSDSFKTSTKELFKDSLSQIDPEMYVKQNRDDYIHGGGG